MSVGLNYHRKEDEGSKEGLVHGGIGVVAIKQGYVRVPRARDEVDGAVKCLQSCHGQEFSCSCGSSE